jgi:nicotinamide-nucleotide amidase
VQTKLLFPYDYPQQQIENLTQSVTQVIGDAVYAIDGLGQQSGDLISVIDGLMLSGQHTLALIETVSHGLLAAKLVGVSWLLSAAYMQSLDKLCQQFHVENQPNDLVSTAKTIAQAIQDNTNADMVLIQLTADIDLGKKNQDSLTTAINVLLAKDKYAQTVRTIAGNIERKQHQAAMLSLDLLRRHLQGKAFA